jgi:hypothetical protein
MLAELQQAQDEKDSLASKHTQVLKLIETINQ